MAEDRTILVPVFVGILHAVMSQDVGLTGNCSRTDRPEPMEIWGVERGPLTCTMLGTISCEGGTLPPEVEGDFMGSPQSLSVEGTLVLAPNGVLSPQIVFTWEPPATAAGFEHLKGFYVEINRFSGISPEQRFYCRVFDFSQNNFTSQDYKLKFKKKMVGFPGGTNFLYRMEMFTLPMSPESKSKIEFFTLQPVQDGSSTASWSTSVSYEMRTLTPPADVTVQFSLAPREYNFRKYSVELVSDHDDKNVFLGCEVDTLGDYICQGMNNLKPPADATTVTHTFHDLGPGSYRVWITPVDPHWQTEGQCLCFERTSPNHTACLRCITTSTGNITVEPNAAGTSPSSPAQPGGSTAPDVGDTKEPPNDVVTGLAVLFGSLFGLILVAVVVMVYRRQRASALRVRKVYLLYTDDHRDHCNVVSKLAIYLRDLCDCEVFFVPWFRGTIKTMGVYQWILSHIDQADYVLVISSEAAFMLFDARNTNTSFRTEDVGPEGDTFSPAVTHIMARSSQPDFHKKTILAHFAYTDEEYIIKDVSPGVHYQLPKYFKEMLCHIHEVELLDKTPKQARINAMGNLQASQCGRTLLDAITKAKHFQKACPQWFAERFQRQDSAYSSQYDHVGDSVSCTGMCMVGTNRVDANHNNYDDDDDDELRSAVTYNTTYARTHDMFPPSEVPTDTPTEFINMQLQNINMQNMDMQNMEMQNMGMQNINMQNMDMQNMEMQNMEMQNMDMQNMEMQNMGMQNINVQNMGMQNLNMQNMDMQNIEMQNINMQNMDLQNVHTPDDGVEINNVVLTHRHSPHEDVFIPPSDLQPDMDVGGRFLAINVGCSSGAGRQECVYTEPGRLPGSGDHVSGIDV